MFKQFALRFSVIVIAGLSAIYLQFYFDKQRSVELASASEAARMLALPLRLDSPFVAMRRDLNYLTQAEPLRRYIESPGQNTLQQLGVFMAEFGGNFRQYFQFRLLDSKGMELLRVERGREDYAEYSVITEHGQDKSARPYFWNTLAKQPGEIYLSAVDLNIEQGELEHPLRSTFRMGTPLVGPEVNKEYILILNYEGRLISDLLMQTDMLMASQLMVLSPNGFWLYHQDEEKRWGHLLKHQLSFSASYPQVWSRIRKSTQGQIYDDNGLFTYSHYTPPGEMQNPDYESAIVSFIPNEQLILPARERMLTWFKLMAYLSPFVMLFTWFWSKRVIRIDAERSTAKQLSLIVQHSKELLAVTNPKAEITYVNPAFEENTGYKADEVMGKNISLLTSGKHDHAFYKKLWNTLQQGNAFSGIFINMRKDGSLLYEDKLIQPIMDDRGELIEYIAIGRSVGEQKDLEQRAEELHKMAYCDALTGLPNRRAIDKILFDAIGKSSRTGQPFIVVYFDLDGFKAVNDQFGHKTGDKLLVAFSKRVSESVRRTDTFGRLAGDEFILIMENFKGLSSSAEKLEAILKYCALPYDLGGITVSVSVSIGAAIHKPMINKACDIAETLQSLHQQADEAMYDAKRAGKNRLAFYENEPLESESSESELRISSIDWL